MRSSEKGVTGWRQRHKNDPQQLFQNLLSNALKYRKKSEPSDVSYIKTAKIL